MNVISTKSIVFFSVFNWMLLAHFTYYKEGSFLPVKFREMTVFFCPLYGS